MKSTSLEYDTFCDEIDSYDNTTMEVSIAEIENSNIKIEVDVEDTVICNEVCNKEIENPIANNIDKDEVWELISRVCYRTKLPLNFLKNDDWQQLFSKLQPMLTLPSQQDLSSHLLDKEYHRINTILKHKIDNALAIAIDIDCMMDNTINVILKIPDVVIFKQISIENDTCTNLVVKILIETINTIGINRIISIGINKNAKILQLRNLLKSMFSESTFECYGCCYNTLNMFIDDILRSKVISLHDLRVLCDFVSTSVNNSHTFRTLFKEDPSSLSFMSDNNCDLILQAMSNLCKNQIFLETIIEEDLNIINYNCKKIIKDKTFWKNLNSSYNLLSSIRDQVKRVKTEGISSIIEIFHELHNIFVISDLSVKKSLILTKLNESENICVTPIHLAANLLDPHFIGNNLSKKEYEKALDFIHKFSQLIMIPNGQNTNGIMYEVAIYKAKQNFFSNKCIWEALTDNNGNKLSPKIWWESFCSNSKLSKIAVQILNFNAYIPPIEHSNFTEYSVANNLPKEQMEKLIFINNNLKFGDK